MKWKTFGNIPSMACIQTSKILSLASIVTSFSWLYWKFQDCFHWWLCCNLVTVLLIKLSIELNVYGCTVIEMRNLLLLSVAQPTLYFVDWEVWFGPRYFLIWSEPPRMVVPRVEPVAICTLVHHPWLPHHHEKRPKGVCTPRCVASLSFMFRVSLKP